MSSKFTSPLLFSSVLALGALGFVACGEEGGPTIPPTPGVSSSSQYQEPEPTQNTAIKFDELGISFNSSTVVKFNCAVSLRLDDSTTIVDVDAAHFTKVTVTVVNEANNITGSAEFMDGQQSLGNVLNLEGNPQTTVDLGEFGLRANLEDPSFTECGNFILKISVEATDGQKFSRSNAEILFERPAIACKDPEQSSSSVATPGAALQSFEVTVNTGDQKCVDLATGLATNEIGSDICFNRNGKGIVGVTSGTGLTFAFFDNVNHEPKDDDWARDYLPPTPTTNSFLYQASALKATYPDILNESDGAFVAIAPTYDPNSGSAVGFYAFIIMSSEQDLNNEETIKLTVYKAK